MPTWDPQLYLAYESERSRPFLDLVARVPVTAPARVVDLGCGAGNLTPVLRARWPQATITGVDASPEMVATARETDPETEYVVADIDAWEPAAPVDVIVSNAALQWLPHPLRTIERISAQVAVGGALAFQVPDNHDQPSHVLLREIAGRPPYATYTASVVGVRGFGPEPCLDLLASSGWRVDAWSTTYLHVLEGEDPVFRWISGTGARPVLQALPDDLRERFSAEYAAALREAYPRRSYGTVLPFPRGFVVAERRVG